MHYLIHIYANKYIMHNKTYIFCDALLLLFLKLQNTYHNKSLKFNCFLSLLSKHTLINSDLREVNLVLIHFFFFISLVFYFTVK